MPTKLSFPATVDMTVPFAPLYSAFDLPRRGIPVFQDPLTGRNAGYDHVDLKNLGRTPSTNLGVLASIGHGKTSTLQTLAYRLGTRTMNGRRLRISADDHRTRRGEPEYRTLCRLLGTEQVKISNYQMNLIDMALGLEFGEQLDLLQECLRFTLPRPLTIDDMAAIRYSLRKVRTLFPKTADLPRLYVCMQSLKREEIIEYRQAFRNELQNRYDGDSKFRELCKTLDAAETEAMNFGTTTDRGELAAILGSSIENILHAAQTMSLTLEALLDGTFGRLFGGGHSLADVLQRRIVALDYSDLGFDAMTLIQSVLWRIKTSAIVRDDHRYFPDIEEHDENPNLWRHEVYARAMSTYMKRIRSTSALLILSTHRLSDYSTVGSEDSEVYKLAQNMLQDIDAWLLGAMDAKAATETQEFLQLSDTEREMLIGFDQPDKVGHWLLKLGSEPAFPVRLNLTRLEKEFTASNLANDQYVVDGADNEEPTEWAA